MPSPYAKFIKGEGDTSVNLDNEIALVRAMLIRKLEAQDKHKNLIQARTPSEQMAFAFDGSVKIKNGDAEKSAEIAYDYGSKSINELLKILNQLIRTQQQNEIMHEGSDDPVAQLMDTLGAVKEIILAGKADDSEN